jgi:hypothetical protein
MRSGHNRLLCIAMPAACERLLRFAKSNGAAALQLLEKQV